MNGLGGTNQKNPQAAPQRLQRIKIKDNNGRKINWIHSIAVDVNASKAKFSECKFDYSQFECGYFRNSEFRNCSFLGVSFYDCNFRGAKFYKCDFRYATFHRCLIDVEEILASIPHEPNIRRESLQNLKANALEMGDYESIKTLVMDDIHARKLHYLYIIKGKDSYYREKYPTTISRLVAAVRLNGLRLQGLVWGYGEKPWRLLGSCIVILAALSFINLWGIFPRLTWTESLAGLKSLEYVVRLFLDMQVDPRFSGFYAIDYIVVCMRYLYIGLFVSVLFRSVSHR